MIKPTYEFILEFGSIDDVAWFSKWLYKETGYTSDSVRTVPSNRRRMIIVSDSINPYATIAQKAIEVYGVKYIACKRIEKRR